MAGKRAGFDTDRLARLTSAIEADVAAEAYDGAAVVVARGGEIALHEAVGFADRASARPAVGAEAAAAFARVMAKRQRYVAGLFRDAGFSPREATARGHLLAIYLMGEDAVRTGASLQARLRLLRREIRVLTEPD